MTSRQKKTYSKILLQALPSFKYSRWFKLFERASNVFLSMDQLINLSH